VKSEGSEDLNQKNLIGKVEGNPTNEPETKPSEQVHRELEHCGQEVEPSLTTSKRGPKRSSF
jgi:hypothetical protein